MTPMIGYISNNDNPILSVGFYLTLLGRGKQLFKAVTSYIHSYDLNVDKDWLDS